MWSLKLKGFMKHLSFLLPILLLSCQLQDEAITKQPVAGTITSAGEQNILINGDFESWQDNNRPFGWLVLDEYGDPDLVNISDESYSGSHSLRLTRNCAGEHFVYQDVPVQPKTYYEAAVFVAGKINDYTYGGLQITSPINSSLGSHLQTYIEFDGYDTKLSVKFFSDDYTRIRLILGFSDGMNANMLFDNCTLIKTASTPSYSQDAQWFANQMGLDAFNEENFDNNVQHLIGKLDYLLIDGYKKFLETSDSSWLEKASHIRANAIARMESRFDNTYLMESLRQPVTDIWIAYCQRSSLVASEALQILNISSREVYFVQNGTGVHQFIEYWNPYRKDWVLIDPFYGIVYQINGDLVGQDLLKSTVEKTGLLRSYVHHVAIDPFYYTFQDLATGWAGTVESQFYGDARKSLP